MKGRRGEEEKGRLRDEETKGRRITLVKRQKYKFEYETLYYNYENSAFNFHTADYHFS
jgi:hypothetical protein